MAGPHSDRAESLEWPDQDIKTNMINLLRGLLEREGIFQEQMDNVSRAIGILRKNQKLMMYIKNTVTDMKNAFHKLSDRLSTAKERISEPETSKCPLELFKLKYRPSAGKGA